MAIAFDATATGSSSGATSTTFAHTCTGSNLILFVSVYCQDGDNVTGVTYNSVAMTLIDKQVADSSSESYLYYLINPSTGSNNVVISRGTSTNALVGSSASYTGAKQTGQPDAHTTTTSSSTVSVTGTVTVVAANSWMIMAGRNDADSTKAGTATTIRQTGSATSIGDSNTALAAGARSLQIQTNGGGSGNWWMEVASFAPAASTTNSSFLNFM